MSERTDALHRQASEVLERMHAMPPRQPGEALRPSEEAAILDLHAAGWTQTAIAERVGCSQPTVSRTLAEYDDSRPLARKLLESRARDVAEAVIKGIVAGDPRTGLKLLGKLDVVREDTQAAVAATFQIHVGQPGRGLQPPAIDADCRPEAEPGRDEGE